MSIVHLPNGLGASTGYSFATTFPLEVNGNVWYVHYGTGTDAASPAGQNRQDPLKTVEQAVDNSSDGDIIVLLDGHEETITSSITVSSNLTIVGEGTSGGYPTAILTNNQAAAGIFLFNAAGSFQLKNIWFEEQAQACSVATVRSVQVASMMTIVDCYFSCGQYNDDWAVEVTSTALLLVKNSTFISTATSIATQPKGAIGSESGATLRTVWLDGVVVDGGTYGWSNYHAIELVNQQPDTVIFESLSLLRGSDVKVHSSATGYINASTNTGGCRIDWDGVT